MPIQAPSPAVPRQRRQQPNDEASSAAATSRFSKTRPNGNFSKNPTRRSFIQRYLCELSIFLLTFTGSVLYTYLNLEAEHADLQQHLPERKRFRTWDWPKTHELPDVQQVWHHAVVTLVLPKSKSAGVPGHEDVSFQYSLGHEHKLKPSAPGHIKMPEFFLDHDVYGVLAWHPSDHSIKNITSYNKQAHLDLFKDMKEAQPQPDKIYEMDVENRQRGLELGWAATYSNLRTKAERDEIESQMLLLGRMYGQVAIYKWWCHQYGPDPREDVSIIQEILPTAAATWNLKISGPVYRIRYEHRQAPYQVEGEYHHTPRKRKPQNDNTRMERRRKHVEWVHEQVRLETIRREENRKWERTKKEEKVKKDEREGSEGL